MGISINMDSDAIFLGLFILMGLGVISVIFTAWLFSSEKRKNESSPLRREHAVLTEKQVSQAPGFHSEAFGIFTLDSGERIRLQIPIERNLLQGDSGILAWQGTAFRGFKIDE